MSQTISVHTSSIVYNFSPREIIRCQASSNYTWFHLTGKRKFLVAKTLGKYERLLSENNFIRIHQTDIINKVHISSIENCKIVWLTDGTCLNISRRRMSFVHKMLERAGITIIAFLLSVMTTFCQPSPATVQADVKKDLGPNCTLVTVLGSGSTSTEYINGGYSTFYRVSLNVKMKTDLPGVTRLLKGAAKYNNAGGRYSYSQYAPGTSEYVGLPAPDTAQIRSLILSMPDYGLTSAGVIVDVVGFSFLSSPEPIWHSLESVSIPAWLIYTRKDNNTTLETVKQPYQLRAYRKSARDPWENVAWTTPDYRNDPRRKESLGKETVGEYKMSKMTNLLEKSRMHAADKQSASRPKVPIPEMKTILDIMKWYHGLLMEGDYNKVEAVTLDLLHADNFDKNTHLLNGIGQTIINHLKTALTNDYSTYSKQNCPNPEIQSKSDTQIAWWNKDKSRSTTLSVKVENGRWFLSDVSVYVWDFHMESRANACMAAACR